MSAPPTTGSTQLGRSSLVERSNGNALVSGASLAVFRILFGVVAVVGALRFLAKGWVDSLYLAPENHLTYAWFDWVQPLPSPFMHLHMVLLAAAGLAIALGWHYRAAMAVYFIGFAYVELIDAALYLNHYWWVTMASAVMVFLPLNRMWSLDARAGRVQASAVTEKWIIWTVRSLLGVVYLFAGIAKLQSDWLFNAMPMQLWLADRTHLPFVGPVLDEPFVAYIASWAGAAFDCTIVFWLLWSKSRPFAYMAVIGFHAATGLLFQIGVFPWLMIAGTLIFFSPDWPLKVAKRLGLKSAESPTKAAVERHRLSKMPIVALLLLAAVQIVVPLRHYAYPDNVRWTEEGYYGAWRVMLTEKAGTLTFEVTDPATGIVESVEPTVVLTDWQATQAAIRPDLMLTAAHLIADEYESRGIDGAEVRAQSFVSFNGRPYQRMADPDVDLASVERGPGHKDFIVPLEPEEAA
jgi:vitamin K-dependent gamma-carboxylase